MGRFICEIRQLKFYKFAEIHKFLIILSWRVGGVQGEFLIEFYMQKNDFFFFTKIAKFSKILGGVFCCILGAVFGEKIA